MKRRAENLIVKNFIHNNYHKLSCLYVPHEALGGYQNLVFCGFYSDAEALFASTIAANININIFCDMFTEEYTDWYKTIDHIPVVKFEDLGALADCALIVSKDCWEKHKDCIQAANIDAFVGEDDITLFRNSSQVKPLWRMNPQAVSLPCVMFGCGNEARKQSEIFQRLGVDIGCYCDNDPQKIGGQYFGKPVISPMELSKLTGKVNVIVSICYWHPVFSQLRQLGFKESNIYINMVAHGSNVYSIDAHGAVQTYNFETLLYRYARGKAIYMSLNSLDATYWLYPASSIGDICMISSCVHECKRKNEIKRVVIVTYDKLRDIALLFPSVDDVLTLSYSNIVSLWTYLYIAAKWESGNIRCIYFRPASPFFNRFRHNDNYNQSLYREFMDMLGLSKNRPERIKELRPTDMIIESNSALLLLGYAITRLQTEFTEADIENVLESIAKRLSSRGLQVYTNTVKSTDKVIPGTKPLQSTLMQLLSNCSRFRAIISAPTGLGELLALSPCNLISFFPDTLEIHKEALDQMAEGGPAVSFLWHKNRASELIDNIVDTVFDFQSNAPEQ